jgi:hypothetical protein
MFMKLKLKMKLEEVDREAQNADRGASMRALHHR